MVYSPEDTDDVAIDTSKPFDTASWNYDKDLPCNDLYFIKQGTNHKFVEVHKALARDDPPYRYDTSWKTGLIASELNYGSVLVHGSALYYFKTRNTGEFVQCARFRGDYSKSDLIFSIPGLLCDHDPTYRNLVASDGKIVVSDGDIYFIKLRNTPHGKVELHRWSYRSNYQEADLHTETPFGVDLVEGSQWDVWAGRLVYIRTFSKSDGNRVYFQGTATEDGRNDYSRVSPVIETNLTNEGKNGDFYVTSNLDVIFVKFFNTRKHIEVHIVDKSKGLIHINTAFAKNSATMGKICLDKASFNPQMDGDAALSKWMSFLPDDTKLTTMTIPGTHDSHATHHNCPEYAVDWAQTQHVSITRQLQYGVRYLDLRIGEGFRMRKGIAELRGSFSACAKEIQNFLKHHPMETVLVSVKWNQQNPAEPSDMEHEVSELWKEKGWYMENDWPELGDVREKAILLRRFEGSIGIDCMGFLDQQEKGPPGAWHQQDDGMNEGGEYEVKSHVAMAHLEDFQTTPKHIDHIMPFTNIAGYDGGKTVPRDYADNLNPRVMEYVRVRSIQPARLGVIILDFIEPEHASNILSWNFTPHRRSRS